MGQSSDIGAQQAAQTAQQNAQIQKAVGTIQKDFSGFTPQFYSQAGQNYENFAAPQLATQYRNEGQQLDYALADKGLTNSGSANSLKSSLGQQYALQQQGVANTAQTTAQNLQQQVQGQENTLVSEAESAQNPSAVASQALSTASQFQSPSVFQPLGQMFNNWSNQYLTGQYASALTPYLTALSTQAPFYGQTTSTGGPGGSPVSYEQ